jgi:hypothetical protein
MRRIHEKKDASDPPRTWRQPTDDSSWD